MRNVGIVGFRGYSGAELVHILQRHTGVEPYLLEHRKDAAERLYPLGHAGPPRLECEAASVEKAQLDLVFLATPPDVSMELTPSLLDAGAKVVDLSGAFRLRTPENYHRWYKSEHKAAELLAEAAYGLPEFHRESIREARLVANPGCYPTAANLAVRPLVTAAVFHPDAGIVCDAKSGVSGAGRKPSLTTSYCEVTENFSAYSLLDHRHVPEVLLNSGIEEREFSFSAHLLPLDRGILETFYFHPRGIGSSEELLAVYEKAYQGECFVRLYDPPTVPDLRAVQRTNFCDIGMKLVPETGRAVVVAAIDNLVKGAAGQAVQNMNLMLGLPETEALL